MVHARHASVIDWSNPPSMTKIRMSAGRSSALVAIVASRSCRAVVTNGSPALQLPAKSVYVSHAVRMWWLLPKSVLRTDPRWRDQRRPPGHGLILSDGHAICLITHSLVDDLLRSIFWSEIIHGRWYGVRWRIGSGSWSMGCFWTGLWIVKSILATNYWRGQNLSEVVEWKVGGGTTRMAVSHGGPKYALVQPEDRRLQATRTLENSDKRALWRILKDSLCESLKESLGGELKTDLIKV